MVLYLLNARSTRLHFTTYCLEIGSGVTLHLDLMGVWKNTMNRLYEVHTNTKLLIKDMNWKWVSLNLPIILMLDIYQSNGFVHPNNHNGFVNVVVVAIHFLFVVILVVVFFGTLTSCYMCVCVCVCFEDGVDLHLYSRT